LAKQPTEDKGGRQKRENDESIVKEMLADQLITYSNFVKMLCDKADVSEATAKRIHKKLKDSGTIVEVNGGYRLHKPSVEDNSADYADEMPF
jgi:ribosomal protein S25